MIEGSVFIEGVRELCNCWRHFRTIRENDFLSLEANIFGPLNETREILFRLDAMADGEIFSPSLEQRVLHTFGGFASTERCGSRPFPSSFLDGRLVIGH
jgi:hypothetical protein